MNGIQLLLTLLAASGRQDHRDRLASILEELGRQDNSDPITQLMEQIDGGGEGQVRNDARVRWIPEFLQSWPLVLSVNGVRLDANEFTFLQQQLEAMITETFDVEYPALMARSFFDVDNSIPEGADVVAYRQFDRVGRAKPITSLSKDLPLVNVSQQKFTLPLVSLGAAYMIARHQLRAAAMSNVPLEDLDVDACRLAIEFAIDEMAATGDSELGISGFLNHASIPSVSPDTGTWSGATSAQIVADITKLLRAIKTNTKGIKRANTLLMATDLYDIISTKQMSTASDKTILVWLKENIRGLDTIDEWERLDTAGSGGVSRLFAYEKNRKNGRILVPMEFQMHAAQAIDLDFKVPCEARCGGAMIPYPKAYATMDGC